MQLPWRYRLYLRLPLWAKRLWGYDWIEDDRVSREQLLAIFNSLKPVETVGPPRPQWIERGPANDTFASGSSSTFYWNGAFR